MALDFDFAAAEKKAAPPERALVFVAPSGPRFVIGFGPGIESDLDAGLDHDEIGPTMYAPKKLGFWIFDGTPRWVEESSEGVTEGYVPDYHNRGTWRRPTTEEMARLCAGDLSQFTAPKDEEG